MFKPDMCVVSHAQAIPTTYTFITVETLTQTHGLNVNWTYTINANHGNTVTRYRRGRHNKVPSASSPKRVLVLITQVSHTR